MIVENWNNYLAAKQLMRLLLNLNHDLRQTASCRDMSIFCLVSFWTVLPSWDNCLSKFKTSKPCYQFEIETIQMFLSFQFSSERLKIVLGIDSQSKVTRTLNSPCDDLAVSAVCMCNKSLLPKFSELFEQFILNFSKELLVRFQVNLSKDINVQIQTTEIL